MTLEAILGRAGTGKSTIMRAHARMRNLAILATTGVAAINQGGQTVHSWCGYNWCGYNMTHERFAINLDKFTSVNGIAIDEISMMQRPFMDDLLGTLHHLESVTSHQFTVLVCGDFGQLPPVGEKVAAYSKSFPRSSQPLPWVFYSDYWGAFADNCTRLTHIHRQADQKFVDALTAARMGQGYDAAVQLKKLGVQFTAGVRTDDESTILYATNDRVNEYNAYKLKLLCRDGQRVSTFRTVSANHSYSVDVCNGAPIMLLANNLDAGWANGTLAKVLELPESTFVYAGPTAPKLRVRILTGPTKDEEVMIGAVNRRYVNSHGTYVDNWIWPFRLAWATTIHKCQGLTLDKVVVNTGEWTANTPGAMYTALSRVRRPEDLIIVGTVDKLAEKIKASQEAMKWF